MTRFLKALFLSGLLAAPALARAQAVGDDWIATHPYEQAERMPAGDGELQDVLEWERHVFEANQYRYRKLQEEWARRAAALLPPDYRSTIPRSR